MCPFSSGAAGFLAPGLLKKIGFAASSVLAALLYYRWVQLPLDSTSLMVSGAVLLLLFLPARVSENLEGRMGAALCMAALAASLWRFVSMYPWAEPGLQGWYGWSDQGSYLNMARKIATFTLGSADYFYGLFYPLLAAPFVRLFPQDPFLPVNLFLYAACGLLFLLAARRLVSPMGAASGLVALAFATTFTEHFVVPWTTSVIAVCFLSVLLIFLGERRPSLPQALWIGASAGIAYATRYVDVVLVLPFFGLWLDSIRREEGPGRSVQIRNFILSGLTAVVITGGVLYSHYVYFGSPFISPYHMHSAEAGQSLSTLLHHLDRIPDNLFGQFLNPATFHAEEAASTAPGLRTPLLARGMLLMFSLLGLGIALREKTPQRRAIAAAAVAAGLHFLVYGLSPGAQPGCIKFHSLHYFKPLLPFGIMLSVLAIERIRESLKAGSFPPGTAAGVLLSVAFCLALFLPNSLVLPYGTRVWTDRHAYSHGSDVPIHVFSTTFWGRPIDRADPRITIDASSLDGQYIGYELPVWRTKMGAYEAIAPGKLLQDASVWNVKLNFKMSCNFSIK